MKIFQICQSKYEKSKYKLKLLGFVSQESVTPTQNLGGKKGVSNQRFSKTDFRQEKYKN